MSGPCQPPGNYLLSNLERDNHEYRWKIQNWNMVQESKQSLGKQTIQIDTGHTKWEIGIKFYPNGQYYYLDWKMIPGNWNGKNYFYTLQFQDLNRIGDVKTFVTANGIINSSKVKTSRDCRLGCYGKDAQNWIEDSEGSLCFLVTLTVMLACKPVPILLRRYANLTRNKRNFEGDLKDSSSSDLKIITNDKQELLANKFVLRDKCPVFATIWFDQKDVKTIRVKDVSGKMMSILLHFFRTGELLLTCFDADTIVEFTFAVGKYKLTQVLDLLDAVLGATSKEETSLYDMQLLKIVDRLSLKNAQARLLERVKIMTASFNSAEQFIALFDNSSVFNLTDLDFGHIDIIHEI